MGTDDKSDTSVPNVQDYEIDFFMMPGGPPIVRIRFTLDGESEDRVVTLSTGDASNLGDRLRGLIEMIAVQHT